MNGLSIADYKDLMKFQAKNKYKNVKTVVDGITFDSKKEAKYYVKLKLLKDAGEITDIELQPRYDLIVNSTKIGFYKADFKVTWKSGNVQVIDAKGMKTPVYMLKRKLMKAIHNITIHEV